ncbi:MAG: molybdate ABC transporter permease subunit [Myxococcota bacterium]
MTADERLAAGLSLQVASAAVALSLPFAVVFAYVLARFEFRGRTVVQGLIDLPLVLPPVVTGYLLLLFFSPAGPVGGALATLGVDVAFTWLGAVVAAAVVGFPLMVRAIRGAIQSVDIRHELMARSLGAGRLSALWYVTLPLARRGVVAGCLLAFARGMGEFGATIMLAGDIPGETRTIPLAIYALGQRVGGFQRSWRLVLLSVLLSVAALILGEALEKRWSRRDEH